MSSWLRRGPFLGEKITGKRLKHGVFLPSPSLAESNMKAIIRATSERKRGRERRGKGKKL